MAGLYQCLYCDTRHSRSRCPQCGCTRAVKDFKMRLDDVRDASLWGVVTYLAGWFCFAVADGFPRATAGLVRKLPLSPEVLEDVRKRWRRRG